MCVCSDDWGAGGELSICSYMVGRLESGGANYAIKPTRPWGMWW